MVMMAVAFEIQDGVDDMFERFWAGDLSVFRHVAGKENGRSGLLR